jgi:cytidylate kinase
VTTGAPRGRTLPVIAIDGPGGSGKSTVARELARQLGWRYLDSGAMYRAVTVAVLEAGTDTADAAAVATVGSKSAVRVNTDPDDAWTELDGRRVTDQIRSRAVTNAVSAVSAVPEVRATLLREQRRIIASGAIVVEGRDIGTTVVPDAEVKVFLTAEPAARATRRHRDSAAPDTVDIAMTYEEINRRDALDASRAASPLAKASDAVELDTTSMSVEQVVAAILLHCEPFASAYRPRTEADA